MLSINHKKQENIAILSLKYPTFKPSYLCFQLPNDDSK